MKNNPYYQDLKRTLMIVGFALVTLFVYVAAVNRPPPRTENHASVERIVYFMDRRTNLCYARFNKYYQESFTVTNVPCTEDVMTLVQKDIDISQYGEY